MKSRKFLIGFVLIAFCSLFTVVGFNAAVNPFGIINTEMLDWHSYNFTQNPRTAKISYLDKNFHNYNAYIIGSSGSSGFPVEKLNQYNDKQNYNLFYYGADMMDSLNTVIYITENYDADEILLPISFSSALSFNSKNDDLNYSMDYKVENTSPLAYYTKYLLANPQYGFKKLKAMAQDSYFPKSFDVFIPESGLYDKRLRDIEYLGSLEEYLENNSSFLEQNTTIRPMSYINEAMDSISKIKGICSDKNIKLTVILIPLYERYLKQFSQEEIELFYNSLSKITGFWDFTYSSISLEPKYFYDSAHFRNAVGEMMLARIYNDSSIYVPDNFGVYHEQNENISLEQLNMNKNDSSLTKEISKEVPILMFHHFDDTPVQGNNSILSKQKMVNLLNYLSENGYTTISFNDLKSYVYHGTDLPEKPIMLTLDDGYRSNYDFLYPLLKEVDMKATIFVIGDLMGADTYKNTDVKIYEHFSVEEAKEMVSSGVIQIGSHTFDMHQSESLEDDPKTLQKNMLKPEEISEQNYIQLIKEDLAKFNDLYENISDEPLELLAYPLGEHDQNLTALLHESGIKGTFTTQPGTNTIIKGLPQTLMNLKRISINEATDFEDLISNLP